MSVAYVTKQSGSGYNSQTFTTGSLTVSGTNTYGLVAIYSSADDLTTGVTWNGVPMGSPIIQLNGLAYQAGLSLYGIVNPSTGTIVASTSAIRNAVVTAMLFSGVYQSTPIGTAATQTQIGSSAINTGSATGVDSTGLFAAGASLYPGSITVTADDGSANAIDDLPDGSLQVRGHSVWIAGSASHTYAATISSSAYHSAFCVYLNAAPVGPTYYPLSRRRRTFFPVFFPR